MTWDIFRLFVVVVVLVTTWGIDVGAQSTQVWPELSTFVKVSDRARFYFLATTVKEDGESTSGEFGPNFDLSLHAFRKPKRWAGFRLDESKNRTLLVRIGYRYLPTYAGDDPVENRGVLEATTRYPLVMGVLVSDRHRVDLRFVDGDYSWRYRNRLSLERELSLGAVTANPYGRVEVFYDSRVSAWSRTEFVSGASFPVKPWLELEGYFDYQHDTGGNPNRTVRALGTVVNIYLR